MSKSKNKALVVGVGDYPAGIRKLPAVAADVREMAKVLRSKDGLFSKPSTIVLADVDANKSAIESALSLAFNADSTDTVFVYLAGHGDVEDGEYYFIPHDANSKDLASTGVKLSWIKQLFDDCKSNRLFLWLDCCRSGGILKKRSLQDDVTVVQRTLRVVSGYGRMIVAACTAEQSAYENSRIGHGLFTDALLRGLRGEAEQHGEVTASGLYDFIDRQIGSDDQRPMQFSETRGRIVLMQYGSRSASTPKLGAAKAKKIREVRSSKHWVMIDDIYLDAARVKRTAEGSYLIDVASDSAERDATIQSLRPANQYYRKQAPFAYGNDACDVEVKQITSESHSSGQIWSLTLEPVEPKSHGFGDGSIGCGNRVYNAEDIAEMRAKLILLDERVAEPRSISGLSMVKHAVENTDGGKPVSCAIRDTYKQHQDSPAWKDWAKLKAVYLLKSTRTVEHVLELTIGALRSGKVSVTFRGRRHQHSSNVKPSDISVDGTCSLA